MGEIKGARDGSIWVPTRLLHLLGDGPQASISASARFHLLICGASGNLYLRKFLKDVEKVPGIPNVNFLPYIITFIVRERETSSHFVPAFQTLLWCFVCHMTMKD